jgi:hypothetical protein
MLKYISLNEIDVISLNRALSTHSGNEELFMNESNIAVYSDRETLFKQVSGFSSVMNPISDNCTENGLQEGCKSYTDTATNVSYLFYYPDDDSVQYLYETYSQISPIDGVTDEHFIVWMRTELMPSFRKLYGKISNNFKSGDVLTFNIDANFEVGSLDGTKSIVLSQLGDYGGRNVFSGTAFITLGSFCLIFGVALIAKEIYF